MSASAGTKVFTTTNNDGKVTFHVTTSATLPSNSSVTGVASPIQMGSSAQPPTPKKGTSTGRGVPPPVPPNKPVIPPKKTSGAAAGMTPHSSAGQHSNLFPVALSGSKNTPTEGVDHGRPISFQVQPLQMAGQVVPHQGIKFGIVISKDKIKVSNPLEQGSTGASEDVCKVANPFKVGGSPDAALDCEAPVLKHEESVPSSQINALVSQHTSSCPLHSTVPETDLLEKELEVFHQIFCSMVTHSCTSAEIKGSKMPSRLRLSSLLLIRVSNSFEFPALVGGQANYRVS